MQPAVSSLHRRSPASIALAPRVILFRLHHLPDDSRTKLGHRLRKKAAISKENRIAKSTAKIKRFHDDSRYQCAVP